MATKDQKPKKPHLSVQADNKDQYERWERGAKADNRTLSSLTRHLLDQFVESRKIK